MNFIKNVINVILPPRCAYCSGIVENENTLCPDCFHKINFITAPYCKICGMPFQNESDISNNLICPECLSHKKITRLNRSAVVYDDFSKKALLALKFADKPENAKLFAKWLKIAGHDIFALGIDLIIPVPLSYQRLLKRHYNQAAVLAQELSKLVETDCNVCALKKIRHTKPQALLGSHARASNIKNAFFAKNDIIKEKRILLIDDIMTTGATLNECAKELLKSGAKSVDTLTVARALENT